MDGRDDALCAAAERILAIREAARAIPDAVATVGTLQVEPGGVNVIPGAVTFTVDVRAPDRARLDELLAAIGLETGVGVEPAAMDAGVVAAVREAIESARASRCSSSPPARATTPGSSRAPASPRGCSSSAAATAASATTPTSGATPRTATWRSTSSRPLFVA